MVRKMRLEMNKLDDVYVGDIYTYIEKILGVDPSKYVNRELYYTCLDKYCIIHEGCGKVDKATLLYSGRWIGLLINSKPYLSTTLYEEIFRDKGFRAAIVVSENGVKNFLYGRDILEISVLEKYPPLDNPIAVIDHSDKNVIGVVEPEGDFYRNIYDLGLFLRIFG